MKSALKYFFTTGAGLRISAMTGALCIFTLAVVAALSPAAEAENGCDPNYDPCVPIASDVDCASGSGNGPAYVEGPVRVIGTDIYGLDRDGDGVGCE
ncbi:MAG: hypothetical protein AAAB11_06340 [Rhizobium giardinii]